MNGSDSKASSRERSSSRPRNSGVYRKPCGKASDIATMLSGNKSEAVTGV
jgi:hypothetical protein